MQPFQFARKKKTNNEMKINPRYRNEREQVSKTILPFTYINEQWAHLIQQCIWMCYKSSRIPVLLRFDIVLPHILTNHENLQVSYRTLLCRLPRTGASCNRINAIVKRVLKWMNGFIVGNIVWKGNEFHFWNAFFFAAQCFAYCCLSRFYFHSHVPLLGH